MLMGTSTGKERTGTSPSSGMSKDKCPIVTAVLGLRVCGGGTRLGLVCSGTWQLASPGVIVRSLAAHMSGGFSGVLGPSAVPLCQ